MVYSVVKEQIQIYLHTNNLLLLQLSQQNEAMKLGKDDLKSQGNL